MSDDAPPVQPSRRRFLAAGGAGALAITACRGRSGTPPAPDPRLDVPR